MEREMLAKVDAELIEVTESANVGPECEDADAVIDTYEQIPAAMIENMKQCKLIIRNRHWCQHHRCGRLHKEGHHGRQRADVLP